MQFSDHSNELYNFLNIAKNIKPAPGEIPLIEGLDIYGETIPLSGDVSGDHIIYVDFAKRFNINERVKRAKLTDNEEIRYSPCGCKRT